MTAAADEHRRDAGAAPFRCALVTLSDTRTLENDGSGQAIAGLVAADGGMVVDRVLLRDDPVSLRQHLDGLLQRPDVQVILLTGGTGIARRDNTISVVESLLDLPLPGFGELFRMFSYEQVGPAAMLSRATGGICRGKVLFAMPGSTAAVELAMQKLILPEVRHLLGQLSR